MGIDQLLTAWKVLIRPITEYAAPLWHSGLSASDINLLESLQKKALGLILGTIYIDHKRYCNINGQPVSYEDALKHFELLTLLERREDLTQKFAVETFKNDIHAGFFDLLKRTRTGTRTILNVQEKDCSCTQYFKSAIPYMSRLLNDVKINASR